VIVAAYGERPSVGAKLPSGYLPDGSPIRVVRRGPPTPQIITPAARKAARKAARAKRHARRAGRK
jgi:hypothetical protein